MSETEKIEVLAEGNRIRHAADLADLRRENQTLRDALYERFGVFVTTINPNRKMKQTLKQLVIIGVAVFGLAMVNTSVNGAPSAEPAVSVTDSTNTTSILSTNAETTLEEIGGALEAGVTNLAVEPFGIYSLQHPSGESQLGGGLGVFYNLNNYIAPGGGLVYLGQLSVFNGSVTVRVPFQPLPTTLPNLWVTPNVLAGLETAVGGAGADNGTVGTLAGGGVSLSYGHLWGGQFNSGLEFVNRTAAGGYSGWAAQPFVGWSKAF